MKRRTIQRALVLSAVHHLKNHPTADEVYQYAAQHTPTISRGTVYRNLAQLEEERRSGASPFPTGQTGLIAVQTTITTWCASCAGGLRTHRSRIGSGPTRNFPRRRAGNAPAIPLCFKGSAKNAASTMRQ